MIDGSWKIARKIQFPMIQSRILVKIRRSLHPKSEYQEGTIPTGFAIVTKTSDELNHQISKSSAYRAASMAKKIVYGKEEDEYNLIKPYFEELKKVSPGTLAVSMDGDRDHHARRVGNLLS